MGHIERSGAAAEGGQSQRFRNIERRWKAAHRGMMDRSWWRTWERPRTSFIVAMSLAAVLLPLDLAFWDDTPLFGSVRLIPTGFFYGFPVVLFLVNAFLVDVFLAWKTRDGVKVRPGARLLRLSLSGIPLVGFYAINFWQDMLARRPPWAIAVTANRTPSSAGLCRAAAQILNRSRGLSFSMLLWLYAGNVLFMVTLSAKLNWLRQQGFAESGIFVFQIALHVVVCCCLADYLRDYVRQHLILGWRRIFLSLLPWLALPLPFPFALASVGAALAFETGNVRQRTLAWKTRFHGDGVKRLASWGHLQDALDKSPGILRHRLRVGGLGRSERTGRVGRRLTAIYRLKTFLLGLDTLAVGWLAAGLAAHEPGLENWIDNLIALFTLALLVGAGLAFLLALARTLLRSLGPPQRPTSLDAHAYGSLLAIGLIIAATGLNVGASVPRGDVQQAAILVMLLLGSGVAIAGLAIMLQGVLKKFDAHQEDRHDDAVWLVLFLALMLASGLMAIDEDAASVGTSILVATALLSPLWHLALAGVFGAFLRQQTSGQRSPFVLATLALPLGGLAVPCWMFDHDRPTPPPTLPRQTIR